MDVFSISYLQIFKSSFLLPILYILVEFDQALFVHAMRIYLKH